MNSYGDDEDEFSSSSDSEEEVLKQFEISVSRSQSFRAAASNSCDQQQQTQTQTQLTQLSLSRRHKFTRLSDQEEGSTEPSDCEGEQLISCVVVFKHCVRSQPQRRFEPVQVFPAHLPADHS